MNALKREWCALRPRPKSVHASSASVLTAACLAGQQVALHVVGHVEAQGKREVGVHFLLHHRHHVEGVPHRVEAQDLRKPLHARPARGTVGPSVLLGRSQIIADVCRKNEQTFAPFPHYRSKTSSNAEHATAAFVLLHTQVGRRSTRTRSERTRVEAERRHTTCVTHFRSTTT